MSPLVLFVNGCTEGDWQGLQCQQPPDAAHGKRHIAQYVHGIGQTTPGALVSKGVVMRMLCHSRAQTGAQHGKDHRQQQTSFQTGQGCFHEKLLLGDAAEVMAPVCVTVAIKYLRIRYKYGN